MVLDINPIIKMEKERIPKEISLENTQGLEEFYEKVYVCTKCKIKYGSDLKKEKVPYLCPMCSLTITNPKKS